MTDDASCELRCAELNEADRPTTPSSSGAARVTDDLHSKRSLPYTPSHFSETKALHIANDRLHEVPPFLLRTIAQESKTKARHS